MLLRLLAIAFFFCGVSASCGAQNAHYTPFIVDSTAVTALLPVAESGFTDRYVPVFEKHGMNANAISDWYKLLQQIARRNETDAAVFKEVSMEETEEGVELIAINFDNLEQMVKTIRIAIATPEKLDAFLSKKNTNAK